MQILTPESIKERVGFVIPRWTTDPSYDRQGTVFRCFPVAGALFNAGYEVVYFNQEYDLDRNDRSEEFLAALEGVRVVFFWMNEVWPNTQITNIQKISEAIRARYPEIVFVGGGLLPTVCTPVMLHSNGPVDYFIRGFGEQAAPKLLAALNNEGPFEEVSGLVWKNGNGYKHNPIQRKQWLKAEDNNVLYHRLDMRPYIQPKGGMFGNGKGTLIIETGRGCAKGCTFCYIRNSELSLLKAHEIVDLVEFLHKKFGVTQYHLSELDLFTSRKRPLDMARLWRERVPECRWFALVSPVDTMRLSDDDWETYIRGGCRKLEFGTESASQHMLTLLGKPHKPEDPYILTKKAVSRGIAVMHNFIYGFVDETTEDRRANIDMVLRLYQLNPTLVSFANRIFQPGPDTPMGDKAITHIKNFPQSLEELLDFRSNFGDRKAHTMPWISAKDERLIKKIVFFYLPMATSKLAFQSPFQTALYRVIRKTAWARLKSYFFAGSLDEALYNRFLTRVLAKTYRP